MARTQYVACVWILLITQTRPVCGDVRFLDRHAGESVVLPCASEETGPAPLGVYLKRSWLRPGEVLFMLAKTEFSAHNSDDDKRVAVDGDPSSRWLNVTISQLRVTDTDRYYCEFVVEGSPVDRRIPGKTEFFLHVAADGPGSADIVRVEACAGGSAVLPCLPPRGEGSAVEGVSLKRQKGRAPVEVLYHSKRHHGASSPPLPPERVLLSTAPGPLGMTYNLTLLQLRPEDSAFYSCQLLVPTRPDSGAGLGRRVFFVSVQGGQCGCSSYTTLLYALSSAVAVLLILLVGTVVLYRGKGHRSVKPQPQAPIYEEMVGVQPLGRKLAPRHLEETDASAYSNCLVKSRPENLYDSSNGGFGVTEEDQK
ncbi:cd7 antigen-like [Centroberyx gerrardi]|uniref:cd7 antigen-like n=1 Tax=Centroberyx gerrardi TaxID=166262 RepID=UPI003AB0684D